MRSATRSDKRRGSRRPRSLVVGHARSPFEATTTTTTDERLRRDLQVTLVVVFMHDEEITAETQAKVATLMFDPNATCIASWPCGPASERAGTFSVASESISASIPPRQLTVVAWFRASTMEREDVVEHIAERLTDHGLRRRPPDIENWSVFQSRSHPRPTL